VGGGREGGRGREGGEGREFVCVYRRKCVCMSKCIHVLVVQEESDRHDDKKPSDLVRGNKVCLLYVHVYARMHVRVTVGVSVSHANVSHVFCVFVSSSFCQRLWA
jgi:hypothetical protein